MIDEMKLRSLLPDKNRWLNEIGAALTNGSVV